MITLVQHVPLFGRFPELCLAKLEVVVPVSTSVLVWGQTTYILGRLLPERNCSTKRVKVSQGETRMWLDNVLFAVSACSAGGSASKQWLLVYFLSLAPPPVAGFFSMC